MPTTTVHFTVKGWDEKPYNEAQGELKMTRSHNAYTYAGDLTGESVCEYLMTYREDGTGSFVGQERIVGRLGGRAGSFVLEHRGTFDKTRVTASVVILPDTGTGELRGLRGEGTLDLGGHAERYPLSLTYSFAE